MIDKSLEEEAELWLSRGSKRYLAGERLKANYRLDAWRKMGLKTIEVSVLWLTSGVGEEDLCVHSFKRIKVVEAREEPTSTFETTLPQSPYSYDGQIVKVCWLVRLRGFFAKGRERVVDAPFYLQTEPSPGKEA